MNIEEFREFCLSLPAVTEDIKWGDNLVFSVGEKMFCLADLNPPNRFSLKVPPEQFDDLTSRRGIIQAPYFARNMWICVENPGCFNREEWEFYLKQSYDLIISKFSKKKREELGI
ncbi:MAG: MmcQ/YjbR family DNA-binding protein [Bacteroidales bacterium]|nr:MmcQ/YjbR family DNA-binding protein [Bacteroidales bacterium]